VAGSLHRLFDPRSIAVVGATDRPGSYGAQALHNLRNAGFVGAVHGVNPNRDEVLGYPCVPSLNDLSEGVDAVVVATPAASVEGVLTQAGELGCGGAVVFAAGFAEQGRQREQDAIAVAARRFGLPVIGPNANGIVNVTHRAPLWGDEVVLRRPGGVAVVTQSGNIGVTTLAARRGLHLHTVVSVGNQAVTTAADVVDALAQESGVRAIALYLEDDGDGAAWADALARCVDAGVRLAVLKAGRSVAGAAAGGAHTAAVAGDHRVFAALMRESGAAWCHDIHDLLETAKVLGGARAVREGGLAVITCSGGDAVVAADEADRLGVRLAQLSPQTKARLAEVLPEGTAITNPLDHTNALWADVAGIAALESALAADDDVAQVLYVQDVPLDLADLAAAEWELTRRGTTQAAAQHAEIRFALASTLPELMPEEVADALTDAEVTPLLGLSAAIAALGRDGRPPEGAAQRLRRIAASAASTPVDAAAGSYWDEHDAKQLLATHGVAVPTGVVCDDADAAVTAAAQLGGHVVIKACRTDLPHKSDVGGVVVDVDATDATAVRAACMRVLAAVPDAQVLVESMAAPGVEVLVAARADAVVPALVVGIGGVWIELLDDVAVIPLPADETDVLAALHRLRAAALLTGGRGGEPVDLPALAALAAAAGRALLAHDLHLVELNPVIARPEGAVAVDAVIRGVAGTRDARI
jgi:acetate---CoA ligase (ADP-forming)